MSRLIAIVCLVLTLGGAAALAQSAKPKLKVAGDGFPTGQDTPEGVACDLVRAFITHDPALFSRICIRSYAEGIRDNYATFLKNTVQSMKDEAAKATPSLGGPKSIGKVFAARHLTKEGPASYGYTVFDFQDVMFVDVGVFLQDGSHALNRTFVIKDKDGKWYVHPIPTISPLLSDGLNEEGPSQTDFSEVYDVQK